MNCRNCGERMEGTVICGVCARQRRDFAYESGLSDGRKEGVEDGREDGLEEGIRRCAVEVDGSPMVEIQHMIDEQGRFEWVSLVNISGNKGSAGFFEPVPMRDIVVRIRPRGPIASARLLKADEAAALPRADAGQVSCIVSELIHYEIVVFEYND